MGFDVMREPWIDCVGLDGHVQTLSIRELLLQAHELQAIRDPSPLQEYGIYRLLTVIAMDMLQPQSVWDVQDLLEKGRFDEAVIDDYIALCEKDGPRFDLFDPVHPFLQDAFDPRYDGENSVRPIALLLPELPSGNNHVHFDHRLAESQTVGYQTCAKALCAISVFCTAGLQGPSSVNGAPPMYVLARGSTLYNVLISNCLCVDANEAPAYATPPPAYRSNRTFSPGEKMASTSLLEGMTLKARRVLLIDGNGAVSRIHFQKGVDFVGYDAWRDPHTVVSAKGTAIKPNMDKELWRNTAMIFGEGGSAPLALRQYIQINGLPHVDVIVYGLCTNQAALVSWSREELSMPLEIVKSDWRMQTVTDAIAIAEEVGEVLETKLYTIYIGKESTWKEIGRLSTGKYYAAVHNALFTSLIPNLLQRESDAMEEFAMQWKEVLRREALYAFTQGANAFGSSSRILVRVANSESDLRKRLKKLLFKEAV